VRTWWELRWVVVLRGPILINQHYTLYKYFTSLCVSIYWSIQRLYITFRTSTTFHKKSHSFFGPLTLNFWLFFLRKHSKTTISRTSWKFWIKKQFRTQVIIGSCSMMDLEDVKNNSKSSTVYIERYQHLKWQKYFFRPNKIPDICNS